MECTELEAHQPRRETCAGDHEQPVRAAEARRARRWRSVEVGRQWKDDASDGQCGQRERSGEHERAVGNAVVAAPEQDERDEQRTERGAGLVERRVDGIYPAAAVL